MSDDPFGVRSLDIDEVRRRRVTKWQAQPVRYAAWIADMDFPTCPAVAEAIRARVGGNELGYADWPSGGPSPAVDAFAARMVTRYGWELSPGRCHELSDVVQGVRLTIDALSADGDGIVLHMPAYHPFLETLTEMRRSLIPVTWDGDRVGGGFDYDDLERRLNSGEGRRAKLWILCHPHNPLGHIFDRSELTRIAEIAERHQLIVISDEIHADIRRAGYSHVPFASLSSGIAARTVTVTSASKSFNVAGLRWAILHTGVEELHRWLTAKPGHYFGFPNSLAVDAVLAAWADGEEWLQAVLAVIQENADALGALLDRHLPGARYTPPHATYLAWVDGTGWGLGDDPASAMRTRGVELSPGLQFGPQGAGHVRLNLATSPSILEALITAMAADDPAIGTDGTACGVGFRSLGRPRSNR